MHSHNYRTPEPFQDQVHVLCLLLLLQLVITPHQFQTGKLSLQSVVVVGLGASGIDIAREISHVAKEVHISARYSEGRLGKIELYHNAWMHSEVQL
jgi:hypothetical protein